MRDIVSQAVKMDDLIGDAVCALMAPRTAGTRSDPVSLCHQERRQGDGESSDWVLTGNLWCMSAEPGGVECPTTVVRLAEDMYLF